MKLTHLLLAALVALPVALTGCDASGPDAASALQVAPATQASVKAGGEASVKSSGPINGPTSLDVGYVATYSRYGAIDMDLKGLSGSAEIIDEYSINDSEGVPTRYLVIRGLSAGGVQVRGVHPNYGTAYLNVTIVGPPPPAACTSVGTLNGPTTMQVNGTATFSANCATSLDIVNESGSAVVLNQTPGNDSQGRPTITGTVRATGSGTVLVRATNGSLSRTKRVMISTPPPSCDQSFSSEGGIWGPKSIRVGDTATYSAYGAVDMNSKGLNGSVTIENEYSINDSEGVPTRYLQVRATNEGGARIRAFFPNTMTARNITICPSATISR